MVGLALHAVDDHKTMWTYIVCVSVVQGTCYTSQCTSFTCINRIMHTNNELATHVILDPYIISYVLAGFLWGHVALHHDLSKAYRLAKSVVISLVPRLSVLVGAILFIGLSLAIIFVPITWDVVVDVLTSK